MLFNMFASMDSVHVKQHYYGASFPFPPPSVREAGNTERGNMSHIRGDGLHQLALYTSKSGRPSPLKLTYVQLTLQSN